MYREIFSLLRGLTPSLSLFQLKLLVQLVGLPILQGEAKIVILVLFWVVHPCCKIHVMFLFLPCFAWHKFVNWCHSTSTIIKFLKLKFCEKDTKLLWNHHLRFVLYSNGQIYGGDFKKICDLLRILYGCHYNPQFVYFLPTFWSPKTFFKGLFFLKL